VYVALTNRCNYACPSCELSERAKARNPTTTRMRDLV
jgi:MoaA/NifB/PqqE/SkfB family radical SAM enzyme